MKTIGDYLSNDTILRYLGYRGADVRLEDQEAINDAVAYILSAARFSKTVAICNIQADHERVFILDSNGDVIEKIESKDLSALLETCSKMILVGTTLGFEISRSIQRLMHSEPSKALILDACASAIVDAFCDQIQDELTFEYAKDALFTTQRFSPGYGDLTLSSQSVFDRFLDLSKKIGVHITRHFQLIPEKSVVFIIGVSNEKVSSRIMTCGTDCTSCRLEYCQFRRP